LTVCKNQPSPATQWCVFSCDAIVDGEPDQLVGDVTGVIEHHDRLIIEGDGVDPEDRAEWEQKWGTDSDD